jgi:hypothetical protein
MARKEKGPVKGGEVRTIQATRFQAAMRMGVRQ